MSKVLCSVTQGNLTHPELLVAVEMLSSVVLMNRAMDVGDRGALWKQLSSSVTGLSNVEDEYAQRLVCVQIQDPPDGFVIRSVFPWLQWSCVCAAQVHG